MNIVPSLCIPQNTAGLGGVAGGGGYLGQPSELAEGHGARSYGIPVIRTTTGLSAQFQIRLTKNIQGTAPADLEGVQTVTFLCKNSQQPGTTLFSIQCQILLDGCIKLWLGPQQVNNRPGIHYAQIHCKNFQGKLIKVFKCLLQIQKGLQGCSVSNTPLTVAQVRMAAYDTCGQHNVLLDDLQFSDAQIIYCMQKALDDWNQMPPSLHDSMTIGSFPYRSKLCTGTLGHLFTMASYRYFRNQMRHSNAGLVYDDQDKGQTYMQLGQANKAQWQQWATTKKTQLNMLQCMGTVSDANFQGDFQYWWR